jgi:hypothetical protein
MSNAHAACVCARMRGLFSPDNGVICALACARCTPSHAGAARVVFHLVTMDIKFVIWANTLEFGCKALI